MRSVPIAATLCVLSVAFAGCSGSNETEVPTGPSSLDCLEQGLVLGVDDAGKPACVEPPFEILSFEDPKHFCVVNKQRDRVHAPDLFGTPWQIGQWWTYSLQIDGGPVNSTKMVYYADQDFSSGGIPQHYMVGTPIREEALQHALFSFNPMIGRVHRILYSPHESGAHADMFHFPLCEGSTWTTVFYGETFTLTATKAPIEVPGLSGPDPGFLIQGESAEGGTLRIGYSPAMQWFTFIDLKRAGGGTVDMQVQETGDGFKGPVHFLRAQKDETINMTAATGPLTDIPLHREDGDEGPYDTIAFDLKLERASGQGLLRLEVLDPGDEVVLTGEVGDLADTDTVDMRLEVPYQAGEWTVRITQAPPPPLVDGLPTVAVEGELRVVSIYDRSGTI